MGEEAAVERRCSYEPGPAFEEVKEESMFDMSPTDSKEFWLIQWIKDKNLDVSDFHGKELSLKLHKDGNLGRLESSLGKSYDLVSFAYQQPNATVFLPSGSETKAVGKISRRVCLVRHREHEELENLSSKKSAGSSGKALAKKRKGSAGKALAKKEKGTARTRKALAKKEEGTARTRKILAKKEKALAKIEKGTARTRKILAEKERGTARTRKILAKKEKALAKTEKGSAGKAHAIKKKDSAGKALAKKKKGSAKRSISPYIAARLAKYLSGQGSALSVGAMSKEQTPEHNNKRKDESNVGHSDVSGKTSEGPDARGAQSNTAMETPQTTAEKPPKKKVKIAEQ